ncbi:type I restriction enzyme HsdR N-terminal domain-containing protein [Maribacter litoralis]|uniref:type I restriction enzyme HsdR N-terminal domain-containing protein n=1 Tax=Maribacter litoralis TaxID=2059726 RepID=UPI000E32235E|nr:type I restriction enzyme HsdR N-terminal domain-containing protein [Maribacter litoralis]
MNIEKWNEICFYLFENIKSDISESDFEQNVIQALRVLDWKEFLGDIQIRPSFQIGASNRIMPDFVINSTEKKKLFVIEIKQPSLPLNTNFQQQLFSYMRQLKLQYGILIGQVIQIFYDGDLTDHDDPVLLETIEFNTDNLRGEKFVELFSKEDFQLYRLKEYTLNSLKKLNRKADQKKLQQKIISSEFQSQVSELIKQNFLNQFDAELIDNVLNEISISITLKNKTKPVANKVQDLIKERTQSISTRDKTKYIINNRDRRLAKNRFVLEVVKLSLLQQPRDFNSLKNLFKDELQGSTGVINKLESVLIKYANKGNKRHFIGDNEILTSSDKVQFVVSTEWGRDNIKNIVDLARELGFEITEV